MNAFSEKLHSLKKSDALIILLIGVLILIAAMPTGENKETLADSEKEEDAESRLCAVLSEIEGVGAVQVMISFSDESHETADGVVVVAEGGDSPRIEAQIREVVMSLFSVEAHRVVVVKMSGQEE